MVYGVDFEKLPESREDAFIYFERSVRKNIDESISFDRNQYTNSDGEYVGSYEPERDYVHTMLAFMDEYQIDDDVEDITLLDGDEFVRAYSRFKARMSYLSTRFELRRKRLESSGVGTVISISSSYKEEIGGLLQTIRKIVNQEISNENKRDKIFSKISSLQSEVDRDRTTVDAVFSRTIDLSKAIGEAGSNIEPLVDKMERLKNIFWDGSSTVDFLPNKQRPKKLPKPDLDDEIPF